MSENSIDPQPEKASQGASPKISWDDSRMRSTYANACNIISTREEVVFFFGISNPATNGQPEVKVELSDRIILSPFAAKRMATLLNNTLVQYEERFGKLSTPVSETPTSQELLA